MFKNTSYHFFPGHFNNLFLRLFRSRLRSLLSCRLLNLLLIFVLLGCDILCLPLVLFNIRLDIPSVYFPRER
jgi:hypothetical protein